MLFHITQRHSPENCPVNEGGSGSLFDPNVPGVKIIGRYGAYSEHVLYYIIEADDCNAVERFLLPGFKRCTATVTPVSDIPLKH